ncbi:MAG TPA: succinylglutamate desuccinylase/aspartoacylase family protein [Sandaracinaceae bacterium LLY-WYZ-13_1]|nr:succinylglutamate desuccinylase/aspartoacylase family protein [Sandaracinaceae bacterium LLY-WYZ-13_1]
MRRPTVVPDPALRGVTRIAASPDLPRPYVGIVGSVHGDERCGLEVLERLTEAARAGELAPREGTWVLVHGNPEATEAGRRYTRGGADLNRLFDFAFEEDLPRARWSPEHERAHALRPVLEDLDVMLDLHSANEPTPPFALINDVPASASIARRLGVAFVTQGWSGPGLLMDRVTIGILQRRERPAVSVECGPHGLARTTEAAWETTLRFLRATGSLEGEAPPGDPTFLEVVEIVSRPSEGFRFTRPLTGLERLEPGEVFAADKVAELRVREPCFALLPNDSVPVGSDMVFLARRVDG